MEYIYERALRLLVAKSRFIAWPVNKVDVRRINGRRQIRYMSTNCMAQSV